MPKLEELAPPFHTLSKQEQFDFIVKYREIRLHDLTTVPEFELSKQAKVKTPKEKKEKKPKAGKEKVTVTAEQLALLKQLGLA